MPERENCAYSSAILILPCTNWSILKRLHGSNPLCFLPWMAIAISEKLDKDFVASLTWYVSEKTVKHYTDTFNTLFL